MSCVKPSASERAGRGAGSGRLTALTGLLWLTCSAAQSGHGHQHGPVPSGLPQAAALACAQVYPPGSVPADLPALAASFRVTWTAPGQAPRQQVWRLRRGAAELVWDKGDAQTDLWRRDAGGIRLDRVLHGEQAVVAYSAGELRTLQLSLDWRALARLLSDDDLAQLQPAPASSQTRAQFGTGLVGSRGQLAGEQESLVWDSRHQLPQRLLRRHAGGQVLFERTALHTAAAPAWPTAEAQSAHYRHIDSADLGDLADDPAARRVQQLDERLGWRLPAQH